MQRQIPTFRLETALQQDGILTLENLPFQKGDCVEVIVVPQTVLNSDSPYPLRGKRLRYDYPHGGVADTEWDASQ
jgi:hypothetical protein